METTRYMVRFGLALATLLAVYIVEESRLLPVPGWAASIGEVLASLAAVALLVRHRRDTPPSLRTTRRLLLALFVLLAIGDLAWAALNFTLQFPPSHPLSILLTRAPYTVAFALGTVIFLGALEVSPWAVLSPTLAIAVVILGPVALRFLADPFIANLGVAPPALLAIQTADIVLTVVLAVVSLTLLVEAAALPWSMAAGSALVLVLGDWSTQVVDRLGLKPEYDTYELFWAGGVFALAATGGSPELFAQPLRLLDPDHRHVRAARGLLLGAGLLTLVLVCLSGIGNQAATVRLVSAVAAFSALGSPLVAHWLVDVLTRAEAKRRAGPPESIASPEPTRASAEAAAREPLTPERHAVGPPMPTVEGSPGPAPGSAAGGPPAIREVIALVHGIRTQAEWQEMARRVLRQIPGVHVESLKYGFFDALRFWLPYGTRTSALAEVERKLRDIRVRWPEARISVLAHSFGTYAVGRLLFDKPDIVLYRLVLCGCVLPEKFRWDIIGKRVMTDVVNDCGERDIWPILARSTTWGYGATGTFGFGAPGVQDRFHAFGHSGFFTEDFAQRFWRTWLGDGSFVDGAKPSRRPYWWSILSLLPLKWVIIALVTLAVWRLMPAIGL